MTQPIITLYQGNEPSPVELTRTHYIFYLADKNLDVNSLLDFSKQALAWRLIAIVDNPEDYDEKLTEIADNIIFCRLSEVDRLLGFFPTVGHFISDINELEENFSEHKYADLINFESNVSGFQETIKENEDKFLNQNKLFPYIKFCLFLINCPDDITDDVFHFLRIYSKAYRKKYSQSFRSAKTSNNVNFLQDKFSVTILRFFTDTLTY